MSHSGRKTDCHLHSNCSEEDPIPLTEGFFSFTDDTPLLLLVDYANYRFRKELWRRKKTNQGSGLFSFLNSKLNALNQTRLISNWPALLQSLNIKSYCSILSFLFC